ncbi:MAG: hypothetical protein ACRDDY_14115 [Clostridium sp.]|uniref:hypothetical protein n=1 Tax=Clostridium sp. TaxID=1506 RepID=UPI003EE51F76
MRYFFDKKHPENVLKRINEVCCGYVTVYKACDMISDPWRRAYTRRGFIAKHGDRTYELVPIFKQPVKIRGAVTAAATLLKMNGFELKAVNFCFADNDSDATTKVSYAIIDIIE